MCKAILSEIKKDAKADWKPPVSMVSILTKDNFTEWIEKYNISLVKFYTPTCVHCQRLEPEFEKAAKALASHEIYSIPLGGVDCSTEFELRDKYQINAYPTLLIFRKGRHYEYFGGTKAHGKNFELFIKIFMIYRNIKFILEIIAEMVKSLKPSSKQVKSFAEFKSNVKNITENYVIGVFNDENDNLFDSYSKFSSKYRDDFKLFHTFEHASFIKDTLKLKVPSIIVYYHDFALTNKESNFKIFDKVRVLLIK